MNNFFSSLRNSFSKDFKKYERNSVSDAQLFTKSRAPYQNTPPFLRKNSERKYSYENRFLPPPMDELKCNNGKLTTLQKLAIISHLEIFEAVYFFQKDPKQTAYKNIINQLKNNDSNADISYSSIISLQDINPSIFYQINLALKGDKTDIDYLLSDPDLDDIKFRIDILYQSIKTHQDKLMKHKCH